MIIMLLGFIPTKSCILLLHLPKVDKSHLYNKRNNVLLVLVARKPKWLDRFPLFGTWWQLACLVFLFFRQQKTNSLVNLFISRAQTTALFPIFSTIVITTNNKHKYTVYINRLYYYKWYCMLLGWEPEQIKHKILPYYVLLMAFLLH